MQFIRVLYQVNLTVIECDLFTEKISQTVKIDASTVEIEERGVKLRLTVVDTPGFGDSLNSQDW
jgi:septin family protein